MKNWLIEKLGGFADIDSAIEAIKEKDGKEKYRILSLAVKNLFNTISSEDILKENEYGQWRFQDKLLQDEEKKLLIEETKQFLNTRLWKVLQKDVEYQANKKMFILAENEIQVAAGKLFLYALDAFRTRLASIQKGSGTFNSKKK